MMKELAQIILRGKYSNSNFYSCFCSKHFCQPQGWAHNDAQFLQKFRFLYAIFVDRKDWPYGLQKWRTKLRRLVDEPKGDFCKTFSKQKSRGIFVQEKLEQKSQV